MFNLKKIIREEVATCIAQLLSGRLNHKTYPTGFSRIAELTIDDVVEILWIERAENRRNIKQLQSDLAAIHAYYRDELCSDCCHADVCSKRASIKFGDYCEDKPLPCCLEIELEETEEAEEISDEYKATIKKQIELLKECNEELANFSKVDNTHKIRDNAREIANLVRLLQEKSPCANTD